MNKVHNCPSGKGTVPIFMGKPDLEDMPAVQFVDRENGEKWCLWSDYDDGSWIPIDYCPYCGLKLAEAYR